jgi:septal ring factor EnvC (AmiA/AmiB activator)
LAAVVAKLENRRAQPLSGGDRFALGQDINKLGYRLEALEDERRASASGLAALRRELKALDARLDALSERLRSQPAQ